MGTYCASPFETVGACSRLLQVSADMRSITLVATFTGKEDSWLQLQDAYTTLSNPVERRNYDQQQAGGGGGFAGSVDRNPYYQRGGGRGKSNPTSSAWHLRIRSSHSRVRSRRLELEVWSLERPLATASTHHSFTLVCPLTWMLFLHSKGGGRETPLQEDRRARHDEQGRSIAIVVLLALCLPVYLLSVQMQDKAQMLRDESGYARGGSG